jgi:hypothetical protein
MNDDPVLRGFTPPAAPDDLRAQAIAAARRVLAAAPARPDAWARLAASRAARLAWAVSIAILAAANVLVPRSAPSAPAAAAASGKPDAELAAITRLPRIDEHSLPALEGGRS